MGFISSLYKNKKDQAIEVGGTYHHIGDYNTIETARVISIKDDLTGIPHVRFMVTVDGETSHTGFEEVRTLGTVSFNEKYSAAY
ncbi:hypothetical protein [Kiloniella sp. b19]|uniref:hypothetical protein n=1 Tax=Kiloniella sp. GXU_MW_B19 TaxID=3141326 RepID=UPI0031DBB9A6